MNKCSKHKRNSKHKPTADCLDCWFSYMADNPEAVITAKDLRRILIYALNIETVKAIAWAAYRDFLERKVGE